MSQQDSHTAKTVSIVMLVTLLGKVLGLVRDILLSYHYGSGMMASAFLTASRIPRVFFDVVFASAIASCFIPVYSKTLTTQGRKNADHLASSFITIIGILSLSITAVAMIFAKPISGLMISSDWAGSEDAIALVCDLTRVMLPSVVFTAAAFCFVGVLQSLGEFNIPALISTVSNLVVILYYLFFNAKFGIFGLAVAFLLGWFLQGAVQLPALRRLKFTYRPTLADKRGLGEIFRLMPAVMLSTWVQPLNLMVHTHFGWSLYDGAGVSAMEHATNLYLIIASVLVLSVTNVIFPKLSKLSAGGKANEFEETLGQTLQSTLFLILPMAAGLMIIASPLISLVFQRGQFDAFSVSITARALFWLAPGMVGYAVQAIISRAYFAKQAGRVPLIAGGMSILINWLLCIWLTPKFEIAGLALASTLSASVYALFLIIPLIKKDSFITKKFVLSMLKMLVCALVMSPIAYGVMRFFVTRQVGNFITIAITALVGACVYFFAAYLFRIEQAHFLIRLLKGRRKDG